MKTHPPPSPLSPTELIDEYFIENRTKLLDIAAFLDRLDRADPACLSDDFRIQAFTEAVAALTTRSVSGSRGGERVLAVQHIFSDPRTEPLEALDRKGALGAFERRLNDGAFQRRPGEARS